MAESTRRSFWTQIYTVFFTLLFLIFFPVILLLFVPIYMFRFSVALCARLFFGGRDLDKLIPTRSAVLAQDNAYKRPRWNLCVWLVLEGNLDLDKFRQSFFQDVVDKKKQDGITLMNPEFQQFYKTWCGFPFWKWDRSFDIKNHIRYYFDADNKGKVEDAGTGTGSRTETTEEELRQIVKELTWKKFQAKKSPWEFLLIPNYKSETDESKTEPKSVLILRCHHSLMDGFSILRLLMKEMNGIDLDFVARPNNNKVKRTLFKKFLMALLFWIRAPFQLFQMLVQGKDENEWHQTPEKKITLPMNSAFTRRIPLSYIKEIKNSYKVSFTAVLMSAVTGGIRRMMIETGKIPKDMTTAVPVPMNHPNLMNHPFKPRNHFIFSFIKLPVGVADSRERLFKMEEILQDLKGSAVPIFSFASVPLVGALFEWMMKPFNTNVFSTVLLSNFPGPPKRANFTMGGGCHRVTDMNFSAGFGAGKVGLGFCMMSYDEGIRIISEADRSILPNDGSVELLNSKIMEELNELKCKSHVTPQRRGG